MSLQSLAPKMLYNEETDASEKMLLEVIENGLLSDAVKIYESLVKKGIGK